MLMAFPQALNEKNRSAARERAEGWRPTFESVRHLSAYAAAIHLNKLGIGTPNNAKWSAKTVLRVRARLEMSE